MNASTRMKLLGVVAGVAAAVAVAVPAQAAYYGDVTAKTAGRPVPTGNGGVFAFDRVVGGPNNDFAGTLVTNDPVNRFIGFCLEVGENINVNGATYYWNVRDVEDAPIATPGAMGATRASDIAKLVTLALGGSLANALTYGADTVAAFQLALWEIAIERTNGSGGSYDLNTGGFRSTTSGIGTFTTDQINQAQAWLGTLSGSNTIGEARYLLALTRAGVQDMLVQTPIPAAAWLLGSGLLGLLGISRRRRQKVAA